VKTGRGRPGLEVFDKSELCDARLKVPQKATGRAEDMVATLDVHCQRVCQVTVYTEKKFRRDHGQSWTQPEYRAGTGTRLELR
jgi:hypothetical protein